VQLIGQLTQGRQALARPEPAVAHVFGDQVGDQQVGGPIAELDAAQPVRGRLEVHRGGGECRS